MNSACHIDNDMAGAPRTGAQIVASAGVLLARRNTVRAGVLCRLLAGDKLTGLEAVYGASTTRLADVIHSLARDYGWQVERTDKVVSCKDGRVQTVTEYHLLPSIISEAMRNGAAAWCADVRAARALLRSRAADAQRAAAQASAARSKRSSPSAIAQADMFQSFGGVAP